MKHSLIALSLSLFLAGGAFADEAITHPDNQFNNIVDEKSEVTGTENNKIVTTKKIDLAAGVASKVAVQTQSISIPEDVYVPQPFVIMNYQSDEDNNLDLRMTTSGKSMSALSDVISAYSLEHAWQADPAKVEADQATLSYRKEDKSFNYTLSYAIKQDVKGTIYLECQRRTVKK